MRCHGLYLIVLTAFGCDSGQTMRPESRAAAQAHFDPDRARSALIEALEAWKKSEARGLVRRAPPIRFTDEDLAAGWRLVDYKLDSPDHDFVPLQDVSVTLSLRDARGQTIERKAFYQVATSHGLAVMRSDP